MREDIGLVFGGGSKKPEAVSRKRQTGSGKPETEAESGDDGNSEGVERKRESHWRE